MTEETRSRPRLSGKKKAVFTLVLVTVAVFGLEGSYRLLLRIQGKPYSASRTRSQLETTISSMRDTVPVTNDGDGGEDGDYVVEAAGEKLRFLRHQHPYLGFWDAPNTAERVFAYFSSRKGRGQDTTLLVVGGSVAAACANTGVGILLDALGEALDKPHHQIQVLNHAHGAFKQPQQALILTTLLSRGWKPDIVVNLDGFNEVAIGQFNAAQGLPVSLPSAGQWAAIARTAASANVSRELEFEVWSLEREIQDLAARFLRSRFYWSAIAGRGGLGHLARKRARLVELQEQYVAARNEGQSLEHLEHFRGDGTIEECVEHWFSASLVMHDLCRERGILYLHVLQPTLHDRGSKKLTPEEIAVSGAPRAWIDGATEGYPLLRARGQELARRGVRFLDGSDTFAHVEETLYYDPCHFNQKGIDLLVTRIAGELTEALKDPESRPR